MLERNQEMKIAKCRVSKRPTIVISQLLLLRNVEVFFRTKWRLGFIDKSSGGNIYNVDHPLAVGAIDESWPARYGCGLWVIFLNDFTRRLRHWIFAIRGVGGETPRIDGIVSEEI
jgi:hypothetical protein